MQPLQSIKPRVNFLYVNIGRGHPFYLDGILEALVRSGSIKLVRGQQDVFEISHGLSRLAWGSAGWIYRKGASSGLLGALYGHIRRQNDYNRPGLLLNLMGHDIRARFQSDTTPLVVSHPTLVGILSGRPGLIYQHGELVAPAESLVRGAEMVIVPTLEVAASFHAAGYSPEQVYVSGLCIEPPLVKQAADSSNSRLARIERETYLTGAFFSSGAEPAAHVEKITLAALSAISDGGRAIVFAATGGRLSDAIAKSFHKANLQLARLDSTTPIPAELPVATLVEFASRREENSLTAKLFPAFDYFVAPSHERSNWALGLSLPMFSVEPCYGPFAPMNRDLITASNVAEKLDTIAAAESFGKNLRYLRTSGRLRTMAEAGWERRPIDGFERIARFLADRYADH